MTLNEIETFEVLREITATSSTNEKKDILERNKENELLKKILYFVFNPFITSGLSDKKLKKELESIPSEFDLSECLDYIERNNTGRDDNIQAVQATIRKYEGYEDLLFKIFSQNFHDLGIAATTINKVWKNYIPVFEVQLAEKYFDNPDVVVGHEFTITEKMDGFRSVAIKENGKTTIKARSGKTMEGLVEIEDALDSWEEDNFVLDCEILIQERYRYPSKTQYKLTSKIVSSKNDYKTGVCLNAFDYLTLEEWKSQECKTPYSERRRMLETFRGRSEYVIITDVIYSGSDISMIEKYHDEAKSKNQEGIMINLNDSMYEFKRTKVLLKCKTFLDCDAYIDDVIEGTGKNTGRVGAFACHFEDESGETIYFEVGSGFTDEDRINFWEDKEKLIGRVCEVKYFEMTVNKEGSKSIRFPVFKTLKEEGTRPHNFEALF